MKNIFYVVSVLVFGIAFTMLYLATSFYYVSARDSIGFQLGEAMGRSLAYMLVAYPLWRWGLFKLLGERKKGGAILCYCLLVLFCSSYQSVNLNKKSNQFNKSQKVMAEITKSSWEGDSSLLPQDVFSPEEYGEIAPILTLMREVADFSNNDAQRFIKACEEALTEGMLLPNELCDADKIQAALDRLAVFVREIDASNARRAKRFEELDCEMELLVKKHYQGCKSILEEYGHEKKKSLILTNEYYRILRDIVVQMQELLRFLQSVPGTYWEENGVMVFTTDELVDTFNAHVMRIMELAEEEERCREKMNAQEQQKINKWTALDG